VCVCVWKTKKKKRTGKEGFHFPDKRRVTTKRWRNVSDTIRTRTP
jgi:hypothetical protein